MRGKLLRFRMSLVLNPCKFFTYDSLDLFWPIQGLTPKPFFYDYIYGDPSKAYKIINRWILYFAL